jgi:hypothetical protein
MLKWGMVDDMRRLFCLNVVLALFVLIGMR